MTALSPLAENRLFSVGIGLAACAVLSFMRQMLILYRDSAEQKSSAKTQYITQGTEDSLPLRTLENLVTDHNYGFRETATRIVCDRALHDSEALDRLLWELTRPDRDVRERAIRAIYMLTGLPMAELNSPKVYGAIVTCLEYCITDVPHDEYDQDFDSFDFRDTVERVCLLVVLGLTAEFGPQGIIQAGIIPKWVAKQPWGSSQEMRIENFRHCFQEQRLSELILRSVVQYMDGLKQLADAGLISTKDPVFCVQRGSREDMLSDRAGFEAGPRPMEQSPEEMEMRRRHRNAMVLNDGIQPVGVGDIIERVYDSPIRNG